MATHEITLHENKSGTKDKAPYLGQYETKATVSLDALCGDASALCGIPSLQIKTILLSAFEIFTELEQEMLTVIRTDIGEIRGKITGSFASADAAFDPDKNKFELALYLPSDIRDGLKNVEPVIVTAETVTKIRVDQVMDNETPKPYSLIHGGKSFTVYGLHLSMADEGAEVYFESNQGIKYAAVVEEGGDLQRVKAHLAEVPAVGCDGKLWVLSRGGDAEGPLQAKFRNVKYLYVAPEPPEITNVYPSGHPEAVDEVNPDGDQCIAGTNFASATKVAFKAYGVGAEEPTEREVAEDEMTLTDNLITFTGEWWIMYQAGIDHDKPVVFEVTGPGGVATRSATYQE